MKTLILTPWTTLFLLLLVFSSPAGAEPVEVGDGEALNNAISAGEKDISLSGDINLIGAISLTKDDISIDGNNHTITNPFFIVPLQNPATIYTKNITFKNLTLSKATGDNAIIMENLDGFTLKEVIFSNNTAQNSTLSLTTTNNISAAGTTFANNNNALGSAHKGSTLFLSQSTHANFSGSTFTKNQTNAINGGAAGAYITGSSNVDFKNSTFTENLAQFTDDLSGQVPTQIGAVGIVKSNNVDLSGSTFTNNTAFGDYGKGGALNITESTGTKLTNTIFTGNKATQGGAIYISNSKLDLTPVAQEYIRFTTKTDTIYVDVSSTLNIGGAGLLQFGGAVTADELTTVNKEYINGKVDVNMTGGTLYLGTGNGLSDAPLWTASNLTVKAGTGYNTTLGASDVTGSGESVSYFEKLDSFHLGDNSTLALDMKYAGNATRPYFTLGNKEENINVIATTGANTTLYGIIGKALSDAMAEKGNTFTYTVFSGSAGDINDFNPTNYRTNNVLVQLANPTYYKDSGTFTIDVVRASSNEIGGLFPSNSLRPDLEQILGSDYLENANKGTLIGKNPLLDGIFAQEADGKSLSPEQRLIALTSAQHAGMLAGGQDLLRSTQRHQRAQLFSNHISEGGTSVTMGMGADSSLRWGEDNRVLFAAAGEPTAQPHNAAPQAANKLSLWLSPLYGHEYGKNFGVYNSGSSTMSNDYTSSITGALLGADMRFGAEGQYLLGTLFTAARGDNKTTGDFMKTTNNADIFGITLFGRWHPAAGWDLGVYTGVLKGYNTVKQSNIIDLEGSFDSVLVQAGLSARYEHAIGNEGKRKLFAELGSELQYYWQDDLTMSHNDQAVGRMDKADSTTVEFPLLFGLKDTFAFENGSQLTIEGHAGYRFTAGDISLRSSWSIPDGQHSAAVVGNNIDRHVGTLGAGVLWEKDSLSVGLDYNAEAGKHRVEHQVAGKIMWTF